jgi:hypothetical protein
MIVFVVGGGIEGSVSSLRLRNHMRMGSVPLDFV